MTVDGDVRRLVIALGVGAMLMAGCDRPAPEVVGRLPDEGNEDLSGLQGLPLGDLCPVGSWTVRTGDLDIFIANLIPSPNLHVTAGSLYIILGASGEYEYGSEGFTLQIDLGPGRYLQGTAFFRTSGAYTADTITLELRDSGSMKQVTEWKAVKDGVAVEAAGAGPEFSLIPNGPVPYQCNDEELVIDWTGPSGAAVPMIFTRETP